MSDPNTEKTVLHMVKAFWSVEKQLQFTLHVREDIRLNS